MAESRAAAPLLGGDETSTTGAAHDPAAGEYLVVARRYRPQTFAELVGQEHVARALSGAIASQRVGHAYLFTGARGVGKTSAARILAKCLNCEHGPAAVPCNRCDSCLRVAAGDDVDVLEIDGASNRGIEEMRELRHNVSIRPSRSRFKVYIIDEVHMLTREAFNALLKTLEEPPEHVKFIFCTTEVEKIPVTILSRCQRFDFAGIQPASIKDRLRQIVDAEGVAADPAALAMLARRAAGSMRDSQSLLEQLLSFGGERITVEAVNGMLGTASLERLERLAGHLLERDAAGAIADLDAAVAEGVDLGQLLDQLLAYLRDLLVAAVGCPAELWLQASGTSAASADAFREAAQRVGIHTLLAMMQILDQAVARLRYSTHARVLIELALVRICQLAELDELSALAAHLGASDSRAPAAPAARRSSPAPVPEAEAPKKKSASPPAAVSDAAAATSASPLSGESASALWRQATSSLTGLLGESAAQCQHVAISGPNSLVATFPKNYNSAKLLCEQPQQLARLEQALAEAAGQPIRLSFALADDADSAESESPPAARAAAGRDRAREKLQHALVARAAELFGARPTRVEGPESR